MTYNKYLQVIDYSIECTKGVQSSFVMRAEAVRGYRGEKIYPRRELSNVTVSKWAKELIILSSIHFKPAIKINIL